MTGTEAIKIHTLSLDQGFVDAAIRRAEQGIADAVDLAVIEEAERIRALVRMRVAEARH